MAQFLNHDDVHPYPFLQENQNPTTVTNYQYHPYYNVGMQNLVSRMEGLSLMSNPYNTSGDHSDRLLQERLITVSDSGGYSNDVIPKRIHNETRHHINVINSIGSTSTSANIGHGSVIAPYMRGRLVSMAMDKSECLSLQQMIEEGTTGEINTIISELKNHLHLLIIHPYGNYVVQKFFQASNVTTVQVYAILSFIIRDTQKLKDACIDHNGTRVIQKIVESVQTQEGMLAILCAIRPITVPLVKTDKGRYVIQQCVMHFQPVYKKVILDEMARNCLDIARNEFGCRAIQKCLDIAEGEAATSQLVEEIVSKAVILAQDPFGNYVVQFVIQEMKVVAVNEMIISRLQGYYVALSMNKYASNVVEKLLQFSNPVDTAIIVVELVYSPEFFNVGPLQKRLCKTILSRRRDLESNVGGKMVLKAAEKSSFHV
ncbi:hypothetical protein RJT34_04450 [Clitoria ternatea]|uniref:PUM-HD domain-containing protein n=1 Tax=Clitoria ternatea TaxID=43366 RepID=A0AAN9KLB4_CLITE